MYCRIENTCDERYNRQSRYTRPKIEHAFFHLIYPLYFYFEYSIKFPSQLK